MSPRTALIVNPIAGRGAGKRLGDVTRAALAGAGHEVVDVSGATLADARGRAEAAIAAGIDSLVVVGGDGMVHLGVNLCAGRDIPLGVVAAGSGNDFARNLGLPIGDATEAAAVVVAGSTRRIDAGRVTPPEGDAYWFGGVLGAGFDAVVNARAATMRWPRGPMRYNLAVLRELPVFRPIDYDIELDGERAQLRAMLVAIANTRSFGGGMAVCPDADVADGLFDVMTLSAVSIPTFLRVFPSVFSGKHVRHPAVRIRRVRHVRLRSVGTPSQSDGEQGPDLPLSVENVPGALVVFVPARLPERGGTR